MGVYDFVNITDFHAAHQDFRSDTEKHNSIISVDNNESADILLARQQADEIINTSGANIKVYIRTDNDDYDRTWDEDPDPTYWNSVSLKAFFKPEPLQSELVQWGVDTPNRTEVVFSFRQLLELFGNRMIRPGDVLQLPYNATNNSPKNYRVLNATPSGNFRYVWLYFTCQVETLTADITVRTEDDMDNVEDAGYYRESS